VRSQIATISRNVADFHAQHMIEEDLAVEIAVDETVGARIEFPRDRAGGSIPSGSSFGVENGRACDRP